MRRNLATECHTCLKFWCIGTPVRLTQYMEGSDFVMLNDVGV